MEMMFIVLIVMLRCDWLMHGAERWWLRSTFTDLEWCQRHVSQMIVTCKLQMKSLRTAAFSYMCHQSSVCYDEGNDDDVSLNKKQHEDH